METSNKNIIPVSQAYKKDGSNYLGSKAFLFALKKKGIIKFMYLGTKPYIDVNEFYSTFTPTPTILDLYQ